MRNVEKWKPTKYLYNTKKGKYEANDEFVSASSKYIANLQIQNYVPIIKKYISGNLLDFGCASVPFYSIYKENITNNICADKNENDFVDYIIDFNKEKKINIEDGIIDSVLLSDVLQYIEKPDILFAEFRRILKASGYLVITIPFFYWIHDAPYDLYRHTEYSLKNFCFNNDLEVIELFSYGSLPDIFLDILNKTKFHSNFALKIMCRISEFKRTKKIRNLNEKKFPLGYILVAKKR